MSEDKSEGVSLEDILEEIQRGMPIYRRFLNSVRDNIAYVVAGAAVVAMIGFGAFYFGRQTKPSPLIQPTQTIEQIVEVVPTDTPFPTFTPTPEPTYTPTKISTLTTVPTNTPIPPTPINTPTPSPTPGTLPGSVLSPGETWIRDGARFTLEKITFNPYWHNFYFVITFENHTGNDYIVLHDNVHVTDNYGNSLINEFSGDTYVVYDGEEEGVLNKFICDYLNDPGLQYFDVLVTEMGNTQNMRWRIPVYH